MRGQKSARLANFFARSRDSSFIIFFIVLLIERAESHVRIRPLASRKPTLSS